MPDSKKKWYVVYTKPRWEKKVHGLLVKKGIEAYCPLNKTKKKWSDRIKWVEEPLLKSYVFVKVRETEQAEVRLVNGVVNFVYWLGKPAVVKDAEISVIKKFLNEYVDIIAEALPIGPDARLKVQRGIFMDKEVKVLKVQRNKVQVIIESIGYSLVAFVDKSNLAAIENSTINY